MSDAVVSAIITGLIALIGTIIANSRHAALIAYRLEQLEKRVEKHNNVVERTYQLEQRTEVQEEKIKVANARIADLEQKVG